MGLGVDLEMVVVTIEEGVVTSQLPSSSAPDRPFLSHAMYSSMRA